MDMVVQNVCLARSFMGTARDLDELERPRGHRVDVEVYVTSLPANGVWRSNEVTGPAASVAAYPTPNFIDMQYTPRCRFRDVISREDELIGGMCWM